MTSPGLAEPGGPYLAEVPEAAADGVVAETYADIRAVLALPIVNLFYRCLAVEPERLTVVWSSVRPNLTSRAVDKASRQLVDITGPLTVSPLPPAELADAGLDIAGGALARATLDAYARANSRNLLAMQALLDGCPGTGKDAEVVEPPRPVPILPMAALDELPPGTLDLLREMSAALVGDEEPILIPSLLRHFAGSSPLLVLLWGALRPVAGDSLAARRDAVRSRARSLAARLPHPVPALEPSGERELAGRFASAMATLLVSGEALRAALQQAP